MSHQVARPGLEVSAHPGQHGVGALAHQGDQLNPVAAVDRDPAMVGVGVAGAVPVEVVPPRSPGLPGVLTDGDLGVSGLVGASNRPELAADRQLPTNIRLGLDVVAALPKSQQMQRATGPGRESRAVEKDAGAVYYPSLPTGWLPLSNGVGRLRLHPAAGGGLGLVLP